MRLSSLCLLLDSAAEATFTTIGRDDVHLDHKNARGGYWPFAIPMATGFIARSY